MASVVKAEDYSGVKIKYQPHCKQGVSTSVTEEQVVPHT